MNCLTASRRSSPAVSVSVWALGRALVRDPQVFLLDEPLGNLDAKLRDQVRYELKKIQTQLGVTTIYVTHDQTEAMTMADHIVLMKDGHIMQQGTPNDLYAHPNSLFVASFGRHAAD